MSRQQTVMAADADVQFRFGMRSDHMTSHWRAPGVSAPRSRRTWRSLRLSPPAKKSTDASSRGNRYPESLSDSSMLAGRHGGTLLSRQPFEISSLAVVGRSFGFLIAAEEGL